MPRIPAFQGSTVVIPLFTTPLPSHHDEVWYGGRFVGGGALHGRRRRGLKVIEARTPHQWTRAGGRATTSHPSQDSFVDCLACYRSGDDGGACGHCGWWGGGRCSEERVDVVFVAEAQVVVVRSACRRGCAAS